MAVVFTLPAACQILGGIDAKELAPSAVDAGAADATIGAASPEAGALGADVTQPAVGDDAGNDAPLEADASQLRDAPDTTACPAGMAHVYPGGIFTYNLGDASPSLVAAEPFCMDATEVTAVAYRACVRAGGCTGADAVKACFGNTYLATDAMPINCVTWHDATEYCTWAKKRLPNGADWEWALRGGSQGWTYPWGNADPAASPERLCWSGIQAKTGPCGVGQFLAGDAPWGVHDLSGNLAEWLLDTPPDSTRFVGGGHWKDVDPARVNARAERATFDTDRNEMTGFRCVVDSR